MAAKRKYNIWTSNGKTRVIGSIEWNTESWDYQTENGELSAVLGEVKAAGEVIGFDNFNTDEYIQDFVEKSVKTTDGNFIPNLNDYLGLAMVDTDTPSVWITPKRKN
jgi:hypothetical protein